jgi:lipopolysaccharide biosynthesis glycosyltransferase
MDILYTSNENYVRHLAASACSLCENNRDADAIRFHVISCEITEESKQKLQALCARYGREMIFYELGDVRAQMQGEVDTLGFDVSILARLFVARFLPAEVERVLYLDCDTIVIDRLEDYWSTALGDCVLAAVPEPVITKSRKPLLEMEESLDYYNSGVLLFDLKKWREMDAERIVLTYFAEHNGRLVAGDQDAINACFKGKIRSVAPKYNYASYNIYYPYRLLRKLSGAAPYVSREVYEESKAHPAIIHYLGEERPWRAGNTHPYADEYKKYLAMTDWHDAPDEEGWKLYFLCFGLFNFFTKPFPGLRYRIIDSLIPAFMRRRAKKLKAAKKEGA